MSIMAIEVSASRKDVEEALMAGLTADEFAALRISRISQDLFAPAPYRDLPTAQTVVEFLASALASGVTYDVAKKVTLVLRNKFGKDKVREVEKPEKAPDAEQQRPAEVKPRETDAGADGAS